MALDVVGLGLILLFFIRGYMKGLIVAVFAVLAIFLGLICSLKLSEALATFLKEHHIVNSGWVQIVSYLFLFIVVFLVVRLIAKVIESAFKSASLGVLNSLMGGILYAFMVAVIWSSFLWLMSQMHIVSEATMAKSKTYPYLSKLAPWIFDKIGTVWPMVKNIFADLQHFFDGVNNHSTAPHVDTAR